MTIKTSILTTLSIFFLLQSTVLANTQEDNQLNQQSETLTDEDVYSDELEDSDKNLTDQESTESIVDPYYDE